MENRNRKSKEARAFMERRGFTLLEVLIAVGLWTVMVFTFMVALDFSGITDDVPDRTLQNLNADFSVRTSDGEKRVFIGTLSSAPAKGRLENLPEGDYRSFNSMVIAGSGASSEVVWLMFQR